MHIDAEHVCEDGLRDVEGNAAEEDDKHEEPLEVFENCKLQVSNRGPEEAKLRSQRIGILTCSQKALLSNTVPLDGQSKITDKTEDDNDGQPNLPGLSVPLVQVTIVFSDGDVVDERENPGASNGIVGSDVRDDVQLGGQRHGGSNESPEQLGEGALSISISLRPVDLVQCVLPCRPTGTAG